MTQQHPKPDALAAAKAWLGQRYLLAQPINRKPARRIVLPFMLALLAGGCATMHKPDETPETKAQDRYQCEQETYAAAAGHLGMLSNGLYRDCMRARGYR